MSKADDDSSTEPPDEITIEAMRRWERWVASVLGVVFGGFGVWAVFVSSNQAGSAVLLLVGAALLLIGIQGTPLIKIGGSTANLELERRRRVNEAVALAQDETNPDVAQGMLQAAAIIEPQVAVPAAQAQARLYEDKVGAALARVFDHVEHAGPTDRHDYVVITPTGKIDIDVKYKNVGTFTISDAIKAMSRHADETRKLVVVTNAPLTKGARDITSRERRRGFPVEVVTWNDGGDNDLLQQATSGGQ